MLRKGVPTKSWNSKTSWNQMTFPQYTQYLLLILLQRWFVDLNFPEALYRIWKCYCIRSLQSPATTNCQQNKSFNLFINIQVYEVLMQNIIFFISNVMSWWNVRAYNMLKYQVYLFHGAICATRVRVKLISILLCKCIILHIYLVM